MLNSAKAIINDLEDKLEQKDKEIHKKENEIVSIKEAA